MSVLSALSSSAADLVSRVGIAYHSLFWLFLETGVDLKRNRNLQNIIEGDYIFEKGDRILEKIWLKPMRDLLLLSLIHI